MRKTIALILSIVLTLSLVCPALADEPSETYYTVNVEYSDAVGRKETLGLMVSDGHVFVDAKQLAERLGYTYGKDANSVTILNTPIRTTTFTVGSTKVSQWLFTDMVDAYEAPFPSIRNEKGDWIPFEYSLLILNSAVMVADDTLLIDIPTKRITDYFDDIVRNKRRYDFDWADDFGYTETDVKVIGTSSHLVNVFNGVLALDGASWASLFQQFAGRMDAYDEKYGERLATLICTESDKELRASAESIKLLEDLLSEDGSLGEMLSSTSAMLDSQVETLYKQCEKVLKKVESGNTPLASYNRTYQALERALDKRTWFSKTGENILKVQKGVSGAVGNAFTLLKVGTMVLEAVGYAQEFQNQDEFSVSALSQYLSNASNVQGLPEKMRESMYGYTRALSGDVSGYMTKRFEDNIVEWVISTAEVADTALVAGTMPSLHEVIGMQAAGALLAWNIASATIPFISNGLSAADSFELALYAMVLQNDAFVNFSRLKHLYPADNPTSQDLFRVSQWCYTYLKSCYTAREAALASLEGKRSAIKEKVKPLVEEQNKINEEIARILVELKGANKDNEGLVYGFLPSDNRRYLNTYDEDALIQQIPSLSTSEKESADSLRRYQDSLKIKSYSVDYLWQIMTYPTAKHRWVVGEGIPDDAALGSELRDFDGDGEDELLVVRWKEGSYTIEMVEAAGGELSTVPLENDLRPQQVIDYPTDAYQMSSPILGVGRNDVCYDEDDAIIVQSWFHTSPFSDGHEWLLDRFEYRGKDDGFVRVGRASMAGTGLGPLELQKLIGQVKETGASTSALEELSEQEAWQFNTLMLSDHDASIQLVARMEADSDAYGADSYERLSRIFNETHEDWCDPQLLGSFKTTNSSGNTDGGSVSADDNQFYQISPEAYAAYAAKLQECVATYGAPSVRGGNPYSAEGVCVAELVDFDASGTEELLVIYYDRARARDTFTSMNDGAAYVAEVWAYEDGELHQAYGQPTQSTNAGFAYQSRPLIDDGTCWMESEEYAGSYYLNLWEIAGGASSVRHSYEVRDEYTASESHWADGVEERRFVPEWKASFFTERVLYELMSSDGPDAERTGASGGDRFYTPYGCVDLAMDTMQKLGVSLDEAREDEPVPTDGRA